jgi:hypothetical protein
MDWIVLDQGACEGGNKISGFIKFEENPDYLRSFYSLRKSNAPWSYSLSKRVKGGFWVVAEYCKCQL